MTQNGFHTSTFDARLDFMKINQWLKEEKITNSEFVSMCRNNGLDISHSALAKWCRGLRIPRKEEMKTIHHCTNGKVSANDFYNLPIAE